MKDKIKAIIEVDIPDYQIGQEVSIYFKDSMMIKGIVQESKTDGDCISRQAVLKIINSWNNNTTKKNIEDLITVINYLDSVNPQKNIINNGTMNITL